MKTGKLNGGFWFLPLFFLMVFSGKLWGIELNELMGKQVFDKVKTSIKIQRDGKEIRPTLTWKFLKTRPFDEGRKNIFEFKLFDGNVDVGVMQAENARVILKSEKRELSLPGVELVLLANNKKENYKCVGSALLKVFKEVFMEQKKTYGLSQKPEAKMYVYAAIDGALVYPKFGFISYKPDRNYDTFFNMVHDGKEFSKYDEQLKKCGM